jgi:hypothetical protein
MESKSETNTIKILISRENLVHDIEIFINTIQQVYFETIDNWPSLSQEKKHALLKMLITQTHSVCTGMSRVYEYDANVSIASGDREYHIAWQPPKESRVKKELINKAIQKAVYEIDKSEFSAAGFILFLAINIIHPYKEGNGRTARMIDVILSDNQLFFNDEKKILDIIGFEDGEVKNDRQHESRRICDFFLDQGISLYCQKNKIDNTPWIRFADNTICGSTGETKIKAIIMKKFLEQMGKEIPTILAWSDLEHLEGGELVLLRNIDTQVRKEIICEILSIS